MVQCGLWAVRSADNDSICKLSIMFAEYFTPLFRLVLFGLFPILFLFPISYVPFGLVGGVYFVSRVSVVMAVGERRYSKMPHCF